MNCVYSNSDISAFEADNKNLKRRMKMILGLDTYVHFEYQFATDLVNVQATSWEKSRFETIHEENTIDFFLEEAYTEKELSDIKTFIDLCKNGEIEFDWHRSTKQYGGKRIYLSMIRDHNDKPSGFYGCFVNDAIDKEHADTVDIIEQVMNVDALTKLISLNKFKKLAESMVQKNKNRQYVIVYSDISNFKYINDTYGYLEGDRVLVEYTQMLKDIYGENALICRVNSDKFLVLYAYDSIEKLRDTVIENNNRFLEQKNSEMPVAAIKVVNGACLVNRYTGGVSAAIDNANTARKRVKDFRKNTFVLYNDYLEKQIYKEMDIITNMAQALEDHEFCIFLQPKVSFADSSLTGAEALVRWIKPDGSMLSPMDFIPIFESNGFIVNLDFYVLEQVCKTLRRWLDEGKQPHPISVNASRVHMMDNQFPWKCKNMLDKYDLPTSLVEIELTESVFLSNVDSTIWMMEQLKALGFNISIDDFGSGYSSLNLLKEMPADILKVDKGFFGREDLGDKDKIIVSGVVSLAKNLDMIVLCEGVETQGQVDFLKSINCDIAQGYYYSKPISLPEFEKNYVYN